LTETDEELRRTSNPLIGPLNTNQTWKKRREQAANDVEETKKKRNVTDERNDKWSLQTRGARRKNITETQMLDAGAGDESERTAIDAPGRDDAQTKTLI